MFFSYCNLNKIRKSHITEGLILKSAEKCRKNAEICREFGHMFICKNNWQLEKIFVGKVFIYTFRVSRILQDPGKSSQEHIICIMFWIGGDFEKMFSFDSTSIKKVCLGPKL